MTEILRQEECEKAADAAAKPDEHARQVAGMFGKIVRWYDPLNHILSAGLDRRWRDLLAAAVLPQASTGAKLADHGDAKGQTAVQNLGQTADQSLGQTAGQNLGAIANGQYRVLDLAAGTLDVALALRRRYPGVEVPAFDFCPPMLVHGKSKLKGENTRAVWPVAADARALPLPDASVHGVTMAFGIRNILPRGAAFAEMFRVLAPGGRACILEFGGGKPKIWCGLYNLYLTRLLPLIGKISGSGDAYRYLAETILHFPEPDALSEEMREAGFGRIYHLPLCSGIVRLHVAEKPGI